MRDQDQQQYQVVVSWSNRTRANARTHSESAPLEAWVECWLVSVPKVFAWLFPHFLPACQSSLSILFPKEVCFAVASLLIREILLGRGKDILHPKVIFWQIPISNSYTFYFITRLKGQTANKVTFLWSKRDPLCVAGAPFLLA